MRIDWIVGQPMFWFLVLAVVLVGVVGIRRDGAVLAAHQAGLVGGRDAAGVEAGYGQAGRDLNAWWGVEGSKVEKVARVESHPLRRSMRVAVRGSMNLLFGDRADLGAGSFQRIEDFYPGPPTEEGWE